jgi:nitrite reductase (NADH) small subunit
VGDHIVGRAEAIRESERVIVEVAGRSIGVFYVSGEFVAVRNRCAHQGGELCRGRVSPPLRAEIVDGRVVEFYDSAAMIITCPEHGWEFDLSTGVCLADPERRVRVYETKVVDGDVVVTVGA